jgi:methionyl-tRNA synthetase
VLAVLIGACLDLGAELEPFVPGLAARIGERCAARDGRLPVPEPVFARLDRKIVQG